MKCGCFGGVRLEYWTWTDARVGKGGDLAPLFCDSGTTSVDHTQFFCTWAIIRNCVWSGAEIVGILRLGGV